MIKKLVIFLLAASLVFVFGCSEKNTADTKKAAREINSLAEVVNEQSRIGGEYFLSITFGDDVVLYHADGDIAWDLNRKTK